ncbi:MAG TPA: C25 family cysteine peptidase [Chitinivibrionales bacterium]|nr:C25 family cysteine peptidase [Chitinivibrionales bacterium]
MKKIFVVPVLIASTAFALYGANEVITNFKDPTIVCDYLIIATKDFAGPAVTLAQHRNSFKYDDVENAKVAYLEDILTAFPGYDYNHRNMTLWTALKWAKTNWKSTFKYLVLIGTDNFVFNPADTSVASNGLMPTWYSTNTYDLLNYLNMVYINPSPDLPWGEPFPCPISDDGYSSLTSSSPPENFFMGPGDTGISIGRIPASTPLLCSLYVEKVKRFDLARPKGPWRNNVLVIADDGAKKGINDPLQSVFQANAEEIVNNSLQGYMVRKRYLSAFPWDQFYEKPAARSAIIESINNGTGWAFFYGYGGAQELTNEFALDGESVMDFTNDSMPFVFLSFTSTNGSILGAQNPSLTPMCQRYLFSKNNGAIVYIANPFESYASSDAEIGQAIFSELKKNSHASVGTILARAKATLMTATVYSSPPAAEYFLLGDPALRVSTGAIDLSVKSSPDSAPVNLILSHQASALNTNYSVTFTVRDSIPSDSASSAGFNMSYFCDSAIDTVSGIFHDSVSIPLPQSYQKPLKAIVYVWNDTADGRAEITIGAGAANPVSQPLAKKEVLGKPVLSKIRGALVIANLLPGLHQIRIFDIRGRIVFTGEAVANLGKIAINVGGKNLGSGRYILQLRSKNAETNLPFVHVAGE